MYQMRIESPNISIQVLHNMYEEELEKYLVKEAKKKGWSENRVQYAARILAFVVQDIKDKQQRQKVKEVLRILENYKVEKQVE